MDHINLYREIILCESCFLSLWINIFNYLSSRSSKSNFQCLGIKKVQAEKNKSLFKNEKGIIL